MCRLPSPKSDHDPESVPTTSNAGAAGSGPRGAMVDKNIRKKKIASLASGCTRRSGRFRCNLLNSDANRHGRESGRSTP